MIRNDGNVLSDGGAVAPERLVAEALASGRTALALQPVIHARQPSQAAFHEGLVRIRSARGTVLPATHFIAAAEEDGIVARIDAEALRQGLVALSLDPALRLSVNLSPQTVGDPRWTRTLEDGLARDPTAAERLIVEITERSAITATEAAAAFMAELQAQSISIALDGFGAGYASFRVLRDLRFDLVKLDGGFCRGVAGHPDNRTILEALVRVARHFGCLVTAEDVETEQDAAALRELGVDCLQGKLFGPPVLWTAAPAPLRRLPSPDWRPAAGCPPPECGLEAER